jgi:tRNA G18 (ribose-2'-O)-methylase SpoU
VRAIVIARGGASPWNDKALRGSMGSLLRIPVSFGASAEEIASELETRGIRQVSAATRGGADPLEFDWRGPCALWISGETGALPAAAKKFDALTIPMSGDVESLNVTVAAAVLLYASRRANAARETKTAAGNKRARRG